MIDPKTVVQIKQSSVEERISIIELILQSLKKDIRTGSGVGKSQFKPFKVHKFSSSLSCDLYFSPNIYQTQRDLENIIGLTRGKEVREGKEGFHPFLTFPIFFPYSQNSILDSSYFAFVKSDGIRKIHISKTFGVNYMTLTQEQQ